MKAVVVVILAVALVSCQRASDTAPAAAALPALKPVALPEMSNASETVQAQLRTRYASLTSSIQKGSTPVSELATAYGEMGKLLIAAEYFDAAQDCFENARTLTPSDMRWPYYLGHVFRLKNDPASAASAFEQALALKRDHVPTLMWLAEMHLGANRVDEAERLLTTAKSLEPDSAAVSYGLGRAALAKQQYAQAVMYLEKASSAAPFATRVQYPLAMAYRGLGNTRAAEAHLKQRGDVDLPPADPLMAEVAGLLQNAEAYETRGSKALESRHWADAAVNLSKAVELAPNNAFTRLNLGTAWYMQGDADRALEQYRAAVRLSPGLARAHFGIGVVMESRGRDREAIDEFKAALTSEPDYVEAQFSLANALRRNGQVFESLGHYREVIRLSPAVSQASFGYAMGLVRLRRYPEAREALQDAMKAFPDQPGFAHALARLLAAAPDDRVRDGARANTIMASLLMNQRTLALAETMAMTQAELGHFADAVRWQREAIDLATQSGRKELVARLNDMLALYEAAKPCRTPWADDDPVHHPLPGS